MFEIYKNLNKIDLSSISIRCNRNYAQNLGPGNAVLQKRRASIRLEKELVRNWKVRKAFFMNRIADDWNKLGNEIIEVKTVNGFKARYDKFTGHRKLL